MQIPTARVPLVYVLAAVLLLGLSRAGLAQAIDPTPDALQRLDREIEAFMLENVVPGALVAVASRGELIHLRTYGQSNVELESPVRDSTVFEIGSISKQFVAAAALLLAEEGKLELDAPIHDYLPGLPGEWLGVTTRQLLNHTSGIPDYEEIRSYDVYRFRLVPDDVIRIAQSRPVDFAPGQGWYYSNTGYYIASMIVERVDGRPLGAALTARIFEPLGMTSTRMADPEVIIKERAAGYWVDKQDKLINRNPTETSSTLGAGGLLTSVHDMVRWDDALYGTDFLSDEQKNTMWMSAVLPTGEDTEYALGWRVTPYLGLPSQSHTGQVAGFVANFARFPEQELTVIVFMNRYRVSSSAIKDAVLKVFMPDLFEGQ